ncbi:acyl-CoA dehydrogenase domain-containing protein [Ramicandelaber brevisporus]|nr:acyl-CoA dehydrogenase domain-containing protein [Ramicandelaber brevisporus]
MAARPNTPDARFAAPSKVMARLKQRARSLGLWNLFMPKDFSGGPGLTNVEYAILCEQTGRSPHLAPEALNCSAPDTGNMEVLIKYGTKEQQEKWLRPLMDGEIRSAFCMTEAKVASSDATNICTSIRPDGRGNYVINGHKWFASGASHPLCKMLLVMGKNTEDPSVSVHRRQSLIIVPINTPGVRVVRPINVFGYDDAPHGHSEVIFDNVIVPVNNIILGEGRGFEVIQGRLGPGRIHHCMRSIGMAERALDFTLQRVHDRTTFGKLLADQQVVIHQIAECRMDIEQARLLVLRAAEMIDHGGAKYALREIAMAKVVVPNAALRVIDRAIQIHGAAGVSPDFPLAGFYAGMRTLRIADGPDEVHTEQIGRLEIKAWKRRTGFSKDKRASKL